MSVRLTALTEPDTSLSSYRLAWLASDTDGIPVGSAFLRLYTRPEQNHLAALELHVHPAERRNRTGSRLLDAAIAAARQDGRRSVITQAEAGSPGDLFLSARGFRRVLTLTFTRLPLAGADMAALTEITDQPHPGYRLASWEGTVPDDLAETFVASRRAMDDMPMGGTDFGTVTWDLDRVRAAAAAVEKRGDLLTTVVALDESDGSIAGFTELVVPGDGRGEGQHYSTGVLPEHRGYGLARWMKAASIRQAHDRHPDLNGLRTDTADNNPYMRRINDALGYVPVHTAFEYQLDL
ncbi:GNAT family N-acetyltransferase [Streptomyces candidus]|uniref:Ribosomal protein S18 acetylase RimI-like enzyme n=1 Tax=Streptomyces candidus TaxID=67283 RepID=A0A7X0HGG3_9ACTN|nr:GNAT family N-acetyltransferase [Streptomyces candidus]MBB6436039.1 ribosomal protein S18 acetylase RimI-like enzyme [Streptomyces candidus]GHH43438.1 N-acetyltransferase [Streptomyces candidus]